MRRGGEEERPSSLSEVVEFEVVVGGSEVEDGRKEAPGEKSERGGFEGRSYGDSGGYREAFRFKDES